MKKLGLFLFVSFFVLVSCKEEKSRQSIDTEEISFRKDGELTFYNDSGDQVKTIEIETARSGYEQETGLMYRKNMEENHGMLFMYDKEEVRPHFYMKNTHISLDLLYINADQKIAEINENAKPFDESLLPSKELSQYVLEINGGMAQKWNLKVGDSLSFKLD